MIGSLLYIVSGILVAVSQLLLKLSANKKNTSFIGQFLNINVIMGYSMLLASMLINMYAMQFMDYKYAPILSTVSYMFVLALSVCVLKERIIKKQVWGAVFIFLGIIIFNLG
ncbi:MAG: EamA family transporter [Roseburia sp.]|nr:EamA family transporter [Roseburia sp.]